MAAVFRAVLGYCFLVLIVRVAGRTPGKQRTPADFVVVFFMGGLTLTAMVADDRSLTNAITIVVSVALTHYAISWLKQRYPLVGRIVDGTPIVLYQKGTCNRDSMKQVSIHEAEVLAALRGDGFKTADEIRYAILERNGEISFIERESAG
jgi:uncharacterized membrane protein YcaP (DUF421 family)